MVSDETGLSAAPDPDTNNLKWSVSLGNNAYASPVVASGRIFMGTNNIEPRDPRHQGDRGVLRCLDEETGALQWQLVVPRIADDKFKDWPMIGMCSPPTVEDDRVYTVTNRFEVVCLDIEGQQNGNDGPYLDEGRHMVPAGEAPMEVSDLDADILWLVDLPGDIGTYPHDAAHVSVLLDGPYLYLNTGNGVDNTHAVIRRPDAPSLIVLDKETGALVARDDEHIGPRIFHATWSSPALGEVNGQRQAYFGGGDGVLYAFKALVPGDTTLERVWRFDCDPTAPKENVAQYLNNRKEGPSNIKGMPVFHDNRVYVSVGGDIWWGKRGAWLKCIDATGEGDITNTGERWSYPLQRHGCSTPSIVDGMVFIADCGGFLHCLDADTGTPYWTHDLGREIWGSTLAADGKVYVGTRGGDLWSFAAAREKRLLGTVALGSGINSTPVAANGVLYVSTLEKLYAFASAETTGTLPTSEVTQ